MNQGVDEERFDDADDGEDVGQTLPIVETRPLHRRSAKGALILSALGLGYIIFLFTRDAGFLPG